MQYLTPTPDQLDAELWYTDAAVLIDDTHENEEMAKLAHEFQQNASLTQN